jgi:hypothetical protein
VELLEYVVTVRTRVLAEEHPDRLASQHQLAMGYEADGQVKKAVELLEHVVAVDAMVLRDDHPSRLISQRALENVRAKLSIDLKGKHNINNSLPPGTCKLQTPESAAWRA